MKISSLPRALIIIDGQCVLCNHWSHFVCKFDHKHLFKITHAQSNLGQNIFRHFNLSQDLKSIILIYEGEVYQESTAVLNILAKLHPLFRWTFILKLIPIKIRDFIYKLIAKNRYRFFGKSETCILITEKQRSRFLT